MLNAALDYPEYADSLKRIRWLSRVLDDAFTIPGTSYRVGLDPLLGLLPGAGDLITFGLSALILVEARRLGVSRGIIARMLANIVIDALLGAIPLIGDLFDFAWKANARNLKLLERYLSLR